MLSTILAFSLQPTTDFYAFSDVACSTRLDHPPTLESTSRASIAPCSSAWMGLLGDEAEVHMSSLVNLACNDGVSTDRPHTLSSRRWMRVRLWTWLIVKRSRPKSYVRCGDRAPLIRRRARSFRRVTQARPMCLRHRVTCASDWSSIQVIFITGRYASNTALRDQPERDA